MAHRWNSLYLYNYFCMKRLITSLVLAMLACTAVAAQRDTTRISGMVPAATKDTTIELHQVNYVTFKNKDDQMEYYKDISRIRTVLPYIRMSKRIYAQIQEEKANDSKRDYRHYRKDLEKDMKAKFEKELKDLTIGQGKVMVKLINRETGNNCYHIIKDIKGGFSAFTWQIVAKHYSYDLKEEYDPHKEWILELAIKSLGVEYDPN